jgi:hypothetical protein
MLMQLLPVLLPVQPGLLMLVAVWVVVEEQEETE